MWLSPASNAHQGQRAGDTVHATLCIGTSQHASGPAKDRRRIQVHSICLHWLLQYQSMTPKYSCRRQSHLNLCARLFISLPAQHYCSQFCTNKPDCAVVMQTLCNAADDKCHTQSFVSRWRVWCQRCAAFARVLHYTRSACTNPTLGQSFPVKLNDQYIGRERPPSTEGESQELLIKNQVICQKWT